MKICKKCYVELDFFKFNPDKKTKDGFKSYCKDCFKSYFKEYSKINKEKIKKRNEEWIKNNYDKYKKRTGMNRDKAKLRTKKWRKDNIIKKRNMNKMWRINNCEKSKMSSRKWRRSNTYKVNSLGAKRRAMKKRATPPWLTTEHLNQIQEYYKLAKEMAWLNEGETLHVDHIIPLQNDMVCGLHVPWNLQLLSAFENSKKSNNI